VGGKVVGKHTPAPAMPASLGTESWITLHSRLPSISECCRREGRNRSNKPNAKKAHLGKEKTETALRLRKGLESRNSLIHINLAVSYHKRAVLLLFEFWWVK
jgi:hypothetical protein